MKFLKQAGVKQKRVLVRADFNVTLDKKGRIFDDFRIKTTIPTIDYLIKRGAKVILAAHLGRPEGKKVKELTLAPIAKRLAQLLDKKVGFSPDCVGDKTKKEVLSLKPGQVLLLENLRFYQGEEKNDKAFAAKLADLAQVYVNDGFGVSHRAHASVEAITKLLPSFAGFVLEREIKVLSAVLNDAQPPLCVVIGGAKISTKMKLIQQFLKKADSLLLGGALANTVLHAQGIAVGKSLIEKGMGPEIRQLNITDTKLHLPVDALASSEKDGSASITIAPIGKTGADELILDIGPDTVDLFGRVIKCSKTVIWNGPMGLFEVDDFACGTKAVAEAIVQSKAFSVVGGGETTCFLEKIKLIDKFSHVSTGGGAMLEFLAGEKLPGLEALEK